ncbi:hypothetical protein D9V37_04145 [Nocardioides mangrovicus]|uniref:YitT family protein n=1 Tax=Nocardioides mangrovicus TaxID=2478913 RepID=A0A3L8P802_9ACTN|nr:hypothetical protein [Nocardioides mangrovicus]RLV51117.1 hypothetical protein D9V37_04145 [Nocardioides mangrovicus]
MAFAPSHQPARQLARLGPLAQLRAGRLGRRLPQLLVGLVLYGVGMALMVRSGLGNMPWDVLHQGLAGHLPLNFGEVVIAVSAVVLLLWVPLREIPGLGTVLNALVIGVVVNLGLALFSEPHGLGLRVAMMLLGLALNALATAMYIGSQFGPGARDGLMTGLHRRTGLSIRLVRTSLEVVVVVLGWLLGGTFGVGTVLYAVVIGPLVQLLLPSFTVALTPVENGRRV